MFYKSQFLSIFLLFSIFSTYQNIHSDCDTSNVTVPVQITQENFDKEVLQAEIPVIFYAFAAGGWSCRITSPIFVECCQEFAGKIKFVAMDVEQNGRLTDELEVGAVPTFLLFFQGRMIAGVEGYVSKEEFQQMCAVALEMCAEITA